MTDKIVKGAREAYNFLATEFGEVFLNLHRYRTFQKKCVQNEIPHWYQESEHKLKIYQKDDLIKWFEKGFPSGEIK